MASREEAGWYVALAFKKVWGFGWQKEAVARTQYLGPLRERSWELKLCTGRDPVSQEGRCRAGTREREPSAFPFYLFQRKSRRYYPTRLAINLSSGVSGAGGTAHQPGFIVVETNYRLYAYTGEATEGPWERRLEMGVRRGKEAGRHASFCSVFLGVYRVF